jgi:hypothetical protein
MGFYDTFVKYGLTFFEPFRLHLNSKIVKSANMIKNVQNSNGYNISQNLILISNQLKKVQKKREKKVINKPVIEKWSY